MWIEKYTGLEPGVDGSFLKPPLKYPKPGRSLGVKDA